MAGRGISIDILANVRDALKGTGDLEKAISDIESTLEDMATSGDDSVDKLSRGFRDLAKDADTSAEKIEQSYKGVGKKIGKDLDAGFDKASEGADNFKEESNQTSREVAASFDGSAESIAGGFQELAANALAGFGPAGAAAGIAFALALGAALQGLASEQEKIQEVRDAARDLSATLYENKGRIPIEEQVSRLFDVLSKERRAQSFVENIVDQWVDFGTILDDVKVAAKETNVPIERLLRALGGSDGRSARQQIELIDDAIQKIKDAPIEDALQIGEGSATIQSLQAARGELEQIVKLSDLTAESVSVVGKAYPKRTAADVQELADAWGTAATNVSSYFTETEEGAEGFDFKKFVKDLEREIEATDEVARSIGKLKPETRKEVLRVWKESGSIAADAFADAVLAESPAGQRRIEADLARRNAQMAERVGTVTGEDLGSALYTSARAKAQGLGPIPVTVKPALGRVTKEIKDYRPPTITIPVKLAKVPGGRRAV